ncbi:MAG: class I SAM-dependent methyltransferase [Acidobacteriota bacterium]|nr:class I SAM-dependent methyltransferase [Acidobacteriota bacterium]
MASSPDVNLWSTAEHALDYLRRADSIPHRAEGEATLLELIPENPGRILDLGSGAGRLITLVRAARPRARFVALDFSAAMLEQLHAQFEGDPSVRIVAHDFDQPLPELGAFGAIVSSFAIHHVHHERKRALYAEIFRALEPGGIFAHLEHVDSPSRELHAAFLKAIGWEDEDPSNKLLDLDTQMRWLREIGFVDVDCHWKWRELALFAGVRPAPPDGGARNGGGRA